LEGLIRIHPTIQFTAPSPLTGEVLKAVDWTIPGMWTMAKLESADGASSFWVDFPYSLALLTPSYLDIQTGEAFSGPTISWYADGLKRAWSNRIDVPVALRVTKFREVRRPVLVNCLYPWHGDAVSLLLRAQALSERGLDVVVMIGPSLERLVTSSLAEAWIVEGNGDLQVWNEGLGRRIKQEVARFAECYLPRSFKPALLTQNDLERATGIAPFARENWSETLLHQPVVTFIMREDRCWAPRPKRRLNLLGRGPLMSFRRMLKRRRAIAQMRDQKRRLVRLAAQLKKISPDLEFAVCGLKGASLFPSGIKDVRFGKMDQQANLAWDKQCARSHVVIGVHGSHTMPHNGLAGSYIELVPPGKWANLLNTPFVTTRDVRETLFCYRFLPLSTSPEELALIILSLLYNYPSVRFAHHQDFTEPISDVHYAMIVQDQQKRFAAIRKCSDALKGVLSP
jgi:hypothetical protein